MNTIELRCRPVFIVVFLSFFLIFTLPLTAYGSKKVFRNSIGMEFILIPAGTFSMGSPQDELHRGNSEISHRVKVSNPFFMQTTEVTLSQWWAIMGKKLFGRRKGPENLPVVKVSWFDARRFIKKLNKRGEGYYRLPTEAEWEYAARAGSTTAYSWGNAVDCQKAMYANNQKKPNECLKYVQSRGFEPDRPAPVKSYAPNAWGLYDMHGNVWEWCRDWFDRYPTTAVTDPAGPSSGTDKVRRGGSWFKHGFSCRSANRAKANPATRFQTTGFRLIWSKAPDRDFMKRKAAPSGLIGEQDGP